MGDFRRHLRREIEVSSDEVYDVSEVICRKESAGSIPCHTDEPVDPFGDCIGYSRERGHDALPMGIDETNKFAQRLNATELGSLAPTPEELLGTADVDVLPEVGQFVFEGAGTENAAL